MTRIKEIYTTHHGIFADLKSANEADFTRYFGNIDTDILDVMFIAKAASKTVSPIVESFIERDASGNITYDATYRNLVALSIWATYGYQWDKAYQALMNEYNPMNGSDVVTETTEEINGTNSSTDTSSNVNAVYGFDSTAKVNDNTGDTSNTMNGSNSSSRTTRVRKTGKDGGYTYGTLLDNALKAARNSFNSIALSNIVNFVTTDIYE